MKQSVIFFMLATLALGACAPAPIPTVDPALVQGSAIAMVSTFAAMTQAAITPTSLPTNTLAPTLTPQPSITPSPDSISVDVSPTSQAGTDECNKPLSSKAGDSDAGKSGTNILIVNNTRATITISLYLAKNVLGDCGYVSYVIAKSNSIFLANSLPRGCYYAHAFIDDPKKPAQVSSGPDCLTGGDKTTFTVTEDKIRVVGP